MKSPVENIDFQMTILSRFDLIFVLRDQIRAEHDRNLAKHIAVHQGRSSDAKALADVIEPELLKRYIAYARSAVQPRLNEGAARMLRDEYVRIRKDEKHRKAKDQRTAGSDEVEAEAIPITVRQLEAVVRIAESLARMELRDVANEDHVRKAIRLFKVSTFQAATLGYLEGQKGSAGFIRK